MGRWKINVDAAFEEGTGGEGFGCSAEALGIREALSWLKDVGVQGVIVEMDAKEVFDALHGVAEESYFDLIDDIKVIAAIIHDLHFSVVKRYAIKLPTY